MNLDQRLDLRYILLVIDTEDCCKSSLEREGIPAREGGGDWDG